MFLLNENVLGKCFRYILSLTDPRVSPLTVRYECPQLSRLIITFPCLTLFRPVGASALKERSAVKGQILKCEGLRALQWLRDPRDSLCCASKRKTLTRRLGGKCQARPHVSIVQWGWSNDCNSCNDCNDKN